MEPKLTVVRDPGLTNYKKSKQYYFLFRVNYFIYSVEFTTKYKCGFDCKEFRYVGRESSKDWEDVLHAGGKF